MVGISSEVLVVLDFLDDRYPKGLTPVQIDAYVDQLGDINPIALRVAAEEIVGKSRFHPSISEMRDRAEAAEANNAVIRAIELIGQISAQVRELENKYYRYFDLDSDGFDQLYRQARHAGLWDVAGNIREKQKRYSEQMMLCQAVEIHI